MSPKALRTAALSVPRGLPSKGMSRGAPCAKLHQPHWHPKYLRALLGVYGTGRAAHGSIGGSAW